MKEFKNINDILDFAIGREQSAVNFYTHLSSKVENSEIKETFLQFAKEEMGHKAILMKVKEEGIFEVVTIKITDIKIADYIITEETEPKDITYPDALVLAMKRERAAFELYKKLANSTDNNIYKNLFENLANQELKHKNRFETEYDDWLSKEN